MLKMKKTMAIIGIIAPLMGALMCAYVTLVYLKLGNVSLALAMGLKTLVLAVAFLGLSLVLRDLLQKNPEE